MFAARADSDSWAVMAAGGSADDDGAELDLEFSK